LGSASEYLAYAKPCEFKQSIVQTAVPLLMMSGDIDEPRPSCSSGLACGMERESRRSKPTTRKFDWLTIVWGIWTVALACGLLAK
jgi:hypothetical protein